LLLAADYPFLDVFWTMIIFFLWVCWIIVLIRIFADIFRRQDTSGWTKALWTIFVIFLPFLGVLVYLIAQGGSMAQRDIDQHKAAQAQFDDYVKTVAGSGGGGGGAASELAKAKELLDSGAISQAEFDSLKAKVLA